ncbi:MAG: PspC domain-containing protein [Chitinophagaceae bacterium]|nr:MAG: PspC domain-containing protein [Chitinophagaceae bacterium]
MNKLKNFIEVNAFGVCSYLGEKIGIPSNWIRLFFIYTSFITIGSPLIVYLSLAFLIRLKNFFKIKKQSSFDF